MSSLQIFDALDPATEAALRASIVKHGVLVPVAVDQNERVLDGHHRSRIATELDIPFPTIMHWVAGDAEAKEIARTLNEDRRQLPTDQRREVVADLREDGHSLRAIGKAVGVHHSVVADDLEAVGFPTPQPQPFAAEPMGVDSEPVGSAPIGRNPKGLPERVTGTDGKSYPAAKPQPTPDERLEQERVDRNIRLTQSFASGIVQVYSTLRGDPTVIRQVWTQGKNPNATGPGVSHLGTPAGIRQVAEMLIILADDLDANQPEGMPWA